MNQAATTGFRPLRPDSFGEGDTVNNTSLPATAGTFRPRDLFLLEVLLAVLAAIAVSVAGAMDGELLLRLLSGSPWMR